MTPELKSAFHAEMAAARHDILAGRLDSGMRHLGTAHVLGQYHVLPHCWTHWMMLRVAYKRRRYADVCGQAVRIILGAFGSLIGIVPRGNTGGSDVGMFKSMPIDPGLKALIKRDRRPGQIDE
ncbi:DUF3703 domain-containing protein [Noviherbaspirillum soli]|uniref:DUF3703 domain-containing protein n=1 Tax=Noviherbaspirillum soli TaxID=1064518 RepID=UPI00188D7B52|nr:DUF3703 domain-containing protein [Noviherbaspirillum soli]